MPRPKIQCQAKSKFNGSQCPMMRLPGRQFCEKHEIALNGYDEPEEGVSDLTEEELAQ